MNVFAKLDSSKSLDNAEFVTQELHTMEKIVSVTLDISVTEICVLLVIQVVVNVLVLMQVNAYHALMYP